MAASSHDHDHPHEEISEPDRPGYYDLMETSVRELLIEKRLIGPDEIRRQHNDGIIIEGWALYGEEMLMRTGLYPVNSASQGQVLRLSRYRAARIGVDVNLHTGRWTFEQAVKYFMEAGGLDREAAEGEAAGAAASPSQKITYMTGKWQIMRLLGKYRDKQGVNFRLGQFHDDLIKNGSLPLSIVEWIMLDDSSSLELALK